MTVKIDFKTNNAAFDGDDKPVEIARILREIASRVVLGSTEGTIHDINGNKIGKYSVKR